MKTTHTTHRIGNPTRMRLLVAACASLCVLGATAQTAPATTGADKAWPSDVIYSIEGRDPDKAQVQWLNLDGYPVSWPGGVYRWYLNTANLPAGITADQLLTTTQRAMGRWAQMCNLTFTYLGTTTTAPNRTSDSVNVVGFVDFRLLNGAPSTGAQGVTLPNYRTASVTDTQFTILTDADIALNSVITVAGSPSTVVTWTQERLEGTLMHEIGHALGLAHSDNANSIMYANPYHTEIYQQTLRGDDVSGCTSKYGASPLQQTNRTLNWAEATYASALNNGTTPPATGGWNGYTYRYYGLSKTYAGSKDGRGYFMGPDGVIQDMGALDSFLPQVQAAGF